MALLIRRGTEAERLALSGANTPASGELLYVTDTKKLYIGDGVTAGGNPISLEGFAANSIVLNYGFTGNAAVNAQFGVERGNQPDVFIRWNESADYWEFTNDGNIYTPIGSFVGQITDNLAEGNVNLYYTNDRANVAFALNSISNLIDVDTQTVPPTDGRSLVWDSVSSNWVVGDPPIPSNLTLTGAYSPRRYSFTANGSQNVFTLTVEPTSIDNLIVSVNGVFLANAAYSLSGLNLTLTSTPTAGQNVSIVDLSSGTTLGAINRTVHSFIAQQGQSVVSVPGGYEAGRVDVFVNGVLLSDSEFVANNGTSVTFLDSLDINDEIKVIKYAVFNSNYLNYIIRKEVFLANIGQTVFTVNGGYRPGFTDVYINGIKMIPGEDFVANDAINVVLTEATEADDYIEICSWITNSSLVNGSNANVVVYTTNDLGEGNTNLYFTNLRARNAISTSGVLNYDANTGVISYDPTLSSITSGNNISINPIVISNTTDSTTVDSGSFYTSGGIGIAKNVVFGGNIQQGTADNRTIQYILSGITFDNSPTEITVQGQGSLRVPITTNTTMYFEVVVIGRRVDVRGESAVYRYSGVVEDINGAASALGAITETVVAEDDANWSANVQVNDADNTLRVIVTAVNNKLVNWMARVNIVETIY
jgi:hypothetical protein